MEKSLITKDNDRMLAGIESMAQTCKSPLNGERFLTDNEVTERLRINRRTLQEYRITGKIPYYKIGGKLLYRESDLQAMLERSYYKAFK